MGAGTTTSGVVYIPDIITRDVALGLAGIPLLMGSGAVVTMQGLRVASNGVGSKVNVPYWANIGEMASLADGDAIVADQLTSDEEAETVARLGKGVLITRGARGAAMNGNRTPDEIASGQILASVKRTLDSALVTRAVRNTTNEWDAYTNDISSASGAAANITPDAIVNTIAKLGDEGFQPEEYACCLMHSAVMAWMLKLKDTVGRNLQFASLQDGVPGGRFSIMGVPILVTDKAPVNTGTYQSVFCKKNSLAVWYDETAVGVEVTRKPENDADLLTSNVYVVVHRYKNLDGRSKPGVAILKHKIGS